ncbi:uncharacterized protein PHALS_06694 [Plasmopara halstedii]|uniref:Uncharacterized protein n=1 Tax=Plasmopara halstedii TaxID=4781 RepID=A0A0N7L851_PLAHL|nr:uncharacterized protein PHALS_06694 [Plasmopara halstedii]CEG48899.1 hypothetical protein PHALS_06694 [Plasmopara halstedii]|eukprot:XP_024585268.1 hypothetical protein PHALS_06694 [Plasmopara halstedii]
METSMYNPRIESNAVILGVEQALLYLDFIQPPAKNRPSRWKTFTATQVDPTAALSKFDERW